MNPSDPEAENRSSPFMTIHQAESYATGKGTGIIGQDDSRTTDRSGSVSALLSVLSKCAAAYESQSQLPLAIKCTGLIITCAPQDPSGYRHLAKLYMKQGKAAAALAVLDNGLSLISEASEQYPDIKMDRETARHRLNLRIDFINKLPSKVILMIIGSLELRDRLTCVKVSKPWQDVLVSDEYAGLWSTLSVGPLSRWSPLNRVLRHSKTLYMCDLTGNMAGDLFSHFGVTTAFKNVVSFSIHKCNISPKLALLGLASMPNLTALSVESKGSSLSLVDLVSTCVQLKTLRFSQKHDSVWQNSSKNQSLPRSLKLESLAIMVKTIHQREVNEIVTCSPELRNFFISGSDMTVLDGIEGSCPNIHVVVLNPNGHWPMPEDVFVQAPYSNTRGLCNLEIYDSKSRFRARDRDIPLIDKNKQHLSKLVVTPPFIIPVINTEISVSTGVAAAYYLTWVEFHKFPSDAQQPIASFLRDCPLISLVLFSGGNIRVTPDIFRALMTLALLKEVYLTSVSIDEDGLESFLDHHSQLGPRSALHTLSFTGVLGVTGPVVCKVGSLSNLRFYRLFGSNCMSRAGLETLIRDLKASNVVALQLGSLSGMTPLLLPSVGDIRSLRYLSLEPSHASVHELLNQSRAVRPPLVQIRSPDWRDSFWKLWSPPQDLLYFERSTQ